MINQNNQSDERQGNRNKALQTLAELLALLGFLLVVYTATIPLDQWIIGWAKQFAPADINAIRSALKVVEGSPSLVFQVIIPALKAWGAGLIFLAFSDAIGRRLGGTGDLWRSMRLTARGLTLSLTLLILASPLIGTLFALKIGACNRSLTYGNEEAFCPLGPSSALIFLFSAVVGLIAFGAVIYAICRAHRFALGRGIVTAAVALVPVLILQSVLMAIGSSK